MGTKLERIAEISAETKKPVFTSIYHLINAELLKQCHKELDGKKAVGVDKVTKEEYGKNLDRNIEDLVQRLKNKSFKPLPSLRVYIPKGNGKMRPLGIASYEDKIVQMAVKKVLEAIYEPRSSTFKVKFSALSTIFSSFLFMIQHKIILLLFLLLFPFTVHIHTLVCPAMITV